MKSCPTCNRTFEDTFTFCLIDGSILSAPFDPRERQIPKQSQEAPPTEIMRAATDAGRPTEPLQSTIRAPVPQVPQWKSDEPVYDLPHKKRNAPRVIRWVFMLRGLAGILIGILTFVSAEAELTSVVLWPDSNVLALFAAYAHVGSGCSLLAGWRTWSEQKTGWILLLDAVVGVVWGLILLWQHWFLPLSVGLAAWPIATGVLQTGAAFQLRKFLKTQWLLALAGVISCLYGLALSGIVALLSRPYLSVGNFARIVWMIAAYEIISGVLLAIFGFSVRARHEKNMQSV